MAAGCGVSPRAQAASENGREEEGSLQVVAAWVGEVDPDKRKTLPQEFSHAFCRPAALSAQALRKTGTSCLCRG